MNRTRTILLASAMLTMLGACGSDAKVLPSAASGTETTIAASVPVVTAGTPPGDTGVLGGSAIQLGGDPCALLTIPEIEAVLGSGVEQGGFGEDLPGHCTYSIGGDVGAGVVQIILQDPLLCNPVLKVLAADSVEGNDAVRVDLGDGGVYRSDLGVVFTTGGGCVAVRGGTGGEGLGQEVLVGLATLVEPRVG